MTVWWILQACEMKYLVAKTRWIVQHAYRMRHTPEIVQAKTLEESRKAKLNVAHAALVGRVGRQEPLPSVEMQRKRSAVDVATLEYVVFGMKEEVAVEFQALMGVRPTAMVVRHPIAHNMKPLSVRVKAS